QDVHGRITWLGPAGALACIVHDSDRGRIGPRSPERDVRLVDNDLLAIASRRNQHGAAAGGKMIDGCLHRCVVAAAIRCNTNGFLLRLRGRCQNEEAENSKMWSDHSGVEHNRFAAMRANGGFRKAAPASRLDGESTAEEQPSSRQKYPTKAAAHRR